MDLRALHLYYSKSDKDKHYMISLLSGISKKKKANSNRVNVAKGMGARERGEADQRVQTSSDKMNRFWGLIYSMVIIVNNSAVYT